MFGVQITLTGIVFGGIDSIVLHKSAIADIYPHLSGSSHAGFKPESVPLVLFCLSKEHPTDGPGRLLQTKASGLSREMGYDGFTACNEDIRPLLPPGTSLRDYVNSDDLTLLLRGRTMTTGSVR